MSKSAIAIATRSSSRNDLIPIPSDSSLHCLAPNSQRFKTAVAKATRVLQDQGLRRNVDKPSELHADVQRVQTALEKQISSDSSVAKSITNLRKRRLTDIPPLAERIKLTASDKVILQQRPWPSVMTTTLHEHISVIVQPYDWDWQRGNGQEYLHSRDGNIAVQGKSGAFPGGSGDRVEAGAGIGLVITSDVQAIAEVRPYITYTWEYTVGAYGAFSSGSARGGVDAAVFNDGALVQPIRYEQFFSDSRGTFGEDHDSNGGSVWVDDVALSFMMDPGQDYAVPYGVWVDCDHSSGIGSAGGGGLVQAQVHFVVVHRWIAG